MSSSVAGALKAALESAGLGVAVFADSAPARAALPNIVIHEAISVTPEPAFNPPTDPTGHVSELAQVDVWQQWRDQTTRAVTESKSLPTAVARALHGVRLPTAPTLVFETRVDGWRRLLEEANNIVHHAMTVRLRRLM
ncbi:MAG: hypothetical protein ABR549_07390 [Mycobacteriales bacterium]